MRRPAASKGPVSRAGGSSTVPAMPVPPAIEAFVQRVSAGDGDAAAEWVHDDAEFQLPGNKLLPIGSAGAQAFASRHGEVEDHLISVELRGAEAMRENVWVTRLVFVNREIASGETMYEMEVGGVFELRDDRIARLRAFASPEEARAAAVGGADR
jgi:ketosteroid isomerase-like protein